MARSHARVFTAIWDDPDFLALTGLAQRCYLMLLSQPTLGHAGVLSTTVRRWTLLCADEDEGRLRVAIAELAEHRFVVVDERTEELLVRSLIRHDGVWKQPKVLAVAITEAARIMSAALRACVAEELGRIDCTGLPDATRPAVEVLLKDLPPRLANAPQEVADQAPPHPPADPPPHAPTEEGAEVLRVRARAAPTPATDPVPSPVPPPAAESGDTAQTLVAEWLDHCRKRPPERVIGQTSKEIKALLAEGQEVRDVREGLARWHQAGQHPSTLASFVNEVMNASPRAAQNGNSRQAATDDQFDRAMERARAREAAAE